MEEQIPHKRRVRYSGTHPKRFEEKYKELNPEKYAADVLTVHLQNFADIDKLVEKTGRKFDFVLADLGVSSMQIDNPARGFSLLNTAIFYMKYKNTLDENIIKC